MAEFQTEGVCPTTIKYDLRDGKVYNVEFIGGCHGNLQAIASLVEGMTLEEVSKRLKGIKCGSKNTSCSDQLVAALGL